MHRTSIFLYLILLAISPTDSQLDTLIKSLGKFGFNLEEQCYGELGCYNPKEKWHIMYRFISVAPNNQSKIDTHFALYTRENKPNVGNTEYIKTGDQDSVTNSHFNADKPIKFIVHGFLDNGGLKWVLELANALLEAEDVNVIAVDWSKGNQFPYFQAVANTWIVGGEIWLLSKFLVEQFSAKYEAIHILGHSLGSHIAGYAGRRMDGQLGRITGLDPAGPFFEHLPAKEGLRETDAMFVDAIHSDGGVIGFGMFTPVGHMDFYPNKGQFQKGCSTSGFVSLWGEGIEEAARNFAACSHQRAITMFTESIGSKCPFIAHECSDFDSYENGLCNSCGPDDSKCARMGYYADQHPDPTGTIHRKLFFTTADRKPLCLYHYSVNVMLASKDDNSGTIEMTLEGSTSNAFSMSISPTPQNSYNHVIGNPSELSSINKIQLSWTSNKLLSYIMKPSDMHIGKIIIEPLDVLPESTRVDGTMTLCQKQSVMTKAGLVYVFDQTDCK